MSFPGIRIHRILLLFLALQQKLGESCVRHPQQKHQQDKQQQQQQYVHHYRYLPTLLASSSSGSTSIDFAMSPTSEEARKILRDHLGLSLEQYQQLAALAVLVVDWNSRINLVSRKDCTADVVFGRHILPSLAPCGMKQDGVFPADVSNYQVVDVGTGGGFPGLPLAIAYPDSNFLLVDSVGKKLAAVQDMADKLGLTNVKTHNGRAEVLQAKFDLCVGRSVAAIPTYCFWIQKLLKKDTGKLLYMIGGEIEEKVLKQAELDRDIDALLQCPGASDKRVLVFPQMAVKAIAAASGEKIKVPMPSSSITKRNSSKSKQSKGEWSRCDPSTPKQRGYDNFKRFDSLSKE